MIEVVARHIIPATFELLPSLASDNAALMLLAIGLQESRFERRSQWPTGPARGFWQFERISTQDVLERPKSSKLAIQFCQAVGYDLTPFPSTTKVDIVQSAIEHNDLLACGMARLKLFLIPHALPLPGEERLAWTQYLESWRPGRPKPLTWAAHFTEASDRIRLA